MAGDEGNEFEGKVTDFINGVMATIKKSDCHRIKKRKKYSMFQNCFTSESES